MRPEPELWIIEARVCGALDLSTPQPEQFFGEGAIVGLTIDAMAKVVYQHVPEAVLRGDGIARWPALIDARFVARPKTW